MKLKTVATKKQLNYVLFNIQVNSTYEIDWLFPFSTFQLWEN